MSRKTELRADFDGIGCELAGVCHARWGGSGIQSHSARYAFAEERMRVYRDVGSSEREARAATSLDLGHGDGRGRYVASIYASGA
ncbi:hypothetical protein [Peristeroidobacter agariperforans]|uniref:hypothetical protein n=1 Tax=Peristeroidobacter agariperforans TaxID=268404 RepID=UPI00101CDF5B|nr:hypothetical protein [Peristeroidobacter agariperforans]